MFSLFFFAAGFWGPSVLCSPEFAGTRVAGCCSDRRSSTTGVMSAHLLLDSLVCAYVCYLREWPHSALEAGGSAERL